MATPQGRRLGYHTPEQVSNQEPPDSRPGVLTTTLLGGTLIRKSHQILMLKANTSQIQGKSKRTDKVFSLDCYNWIRPNKMEPSSYHGQLETICNLEASPLLHVQSQRVS